MLEQSRQSLRDELCFHIDNDNLRIRAGQLRARMRMYPVMVATQVLLEPLFVWLMWEQASFHGRGLISWLVAMYALHALEMTVWWRHRNQLDTVEGCRRCSVSFNLFTFIIGLGWGSTALWLSMPDLAHQALLICVMLGLAAGAATMNPVYPPALYIFVLSVMLPLIFRIMLANDETHWALTSMLLLYLVSVLRAGRELGQTFWSSLKQRDENQSLVDQLTEQKMLAEQARKEAEMASREKSRFLAVASHDLRQPLQALALFSEALTDRAQEQEIRHLAGQIDKSVHALVSMFDELLDVSRLDAGVVEPRWQNFELQPLLDRLYLDFALLAQEKGLRFDIPAAVGEPAYSAEQGSLVVCSDPFLLERMLRNLISNAIRYTASGSVQLRRTCVDGSLKFEVVDTGCGIRVEDVPHIFEEYYQADNPNRDRRKGLGLGLAIVRRLQKLLGYQMEVLSEPGKGSLFGFSVELGDGEQLSYPFASSRSGQDVGGTMVALPEDDPEISQIVSALTYPFMMASRAGQDLSGTVVVLLEDDPDIRQIVSALMEQWGCRVLPGELPEEVMRSWQHGDEPPALLLCDYRLPRGMTATQAIRQMREFWDADIPAIVLTGDTAQEMLHEVYASGALLLHKPIAPARLRSFMHLALHGGN